MRNAIFSLSSAIALSALSACAANPSSSAKIYDAAQELNVNARFGRMQMALEHVAAKNRDEFVKRHRQWGGNVRIADTEGAGIKMKGEKDAEVLVRFAWYRPSEQELRITTVKQSWKAGEGGWQLVGEERQDGDEGLLGEPVEVLVPTEKRNAQFPTVRIGAGNE